MSRTLRRVLMISAGVAALSGELAAPNSAEAGGYIAPNDPPEVQQRCLAAGGRLEQEKYGYSWCLTPAMDDRCNQISPAEYDKDGNRVSWYYDVSTDTCKPGGCFLTTACVDFAGLPDDCFELATLRRFRDEVLMRMPGGPDDVALYDRVAPAIVERIGGSPNRSRELARLYVLYILPSVVAACFGRARLARRIYTRMMRDLAARYRVALG